MYGRLVSPILRQALKRRNFSSSSGSIPQGVWNLGRLNHIAIATPDLPNSIALYRDVFRASVRYVRIDWPSMVKLNIFFIFLSAPEDLPDHGVTVVFIELDNTKIELPKVYCISPDRKLDVLLNFFRGLNFWNSGFKGNRILILLNNVLNYNQSKRWIGKSCFYSNNTKYLLYSYYVQKDNLIYHMILSKPVNSFVLFV